MLALDVLNEPLFFNKQNWAAGYSADVAVQAEFVRDLSAHLSCWSNHLGRSDVTVAKVAAPASDPSLRKLPRSIQFQGLSLLGLKPGSFGIFIIWRRVDNSPVPQKKKKKTVSRSLQNKHEQLKAKAADTSGKQARRKVKKVKRQASKQQSGQKQASPPQLARSEAAGAQPALEQQGLVPDDEPLLTAFFPLPEGITSLPIVEGPPATLARLRPVPSSAAKGLGSPLPVASSPSASMPDAASPLAGKRRGPESMSDVESLGAAEAPSADSLALVP
ncbi:TPA: hypothetical protein ACH3X2_001365 [Trebouxia sp. C0005]